MAEDSKALDFSGIQVCVRARPLNDRERDGGFRNCISFDEATQQVVLSAVDRNTLMQLRGQTAKGYAFDRRYGPEHTSDNIYDDCMCHLVDNLFKGYNATVLAYGQTGSGKTLTMSGGKGIFGKSETGIIRRAAQHILGNVEAVQAKLKPGESISVRAYALELYNEELRDLSGKVQHQQQPQGPMAAAAGAQDGEGGVRIAERPVGKDGRCIPEVVGVTTVEVADANSLVNFFAECFDNRAVAATKMNDRSSRSHAIYTVLINRTLVDVSEVGDKVRTVRVESRFNLVDLAGSERVKRSGVTGAAFKEAVHINGGLLALGNVIVALSGGHEDGPEGAEDKAALLNTGGSVTARSSAKKHIPYRDSKLTRLLQDSLGGSALTVLISCISSCEADFEETNSTLKYANRACKIKNSPLPNKQLMMEEDLLPLLPANATASGNSMSMMQMQMLLAEHAKMKEAREKREAEKKEKEEKRLAELRALREAETKAPGFQRLRMAQYDELRKKLVSSHGGKLVKGEVISDDTLAGFKKRNASEGEGSLSAGGPDNRPHYLRPTSAGASRVASPVNGRSNRPASATRLYSNQRMRGSNAGSPWDTPRSNGTSTPDIMSVEASPSSARINEQGEQQQQRPGSGRSSSRSSCRSSDAEERVDGYASRASSASRRLLRQMQEMSVGTEEDGAAAAAWDAAGLKLKAAVTAVDEGTCTSPMGSETIKACYELNGTEDSSCQAAGDAASQQQSRRSSISRATSASPAALAASNTISRATSAMPSVFGSAAAQANISRAIRGTQAALAEAAAAGLPQQVSGSISRADSAAPSAAAAAAAGSPSGRPPLAPSSSATTGSYAALHSQSAAYTVLAFNQPEADAKQQQQKDGEAAEELDTAELVPVPPPQLLARFRVNQTDTLAVFRAVSTEDFADVASLLPPNTALPAADKMTYLLARLEVHTYTSEQLCAALDAVASGAASISAAVGPAVGCLMATFGTSLITDCIFDFEDPEQLAEVGLQQRLELWGLQIPHTSIRPALFAEDRSAPAQQPAAAARATSPSPGEVTPRRSSFSHPSGGSPAAGAGGRRSSVHSQQMGNNSSLLSQQHSLPQQLQEQPQQPQENLMCWSSADRLNVSIGLMYALCNLAKELGAAAGFCVPRPQLLRRWLQSGVKMKQVSPPTKLIYPPSAHDYTYYKSSTVAYFLVDEVKESLGKVLSMLKQAS